MNNPTKHRRHRRIPGPPTATPVARITLPKLPLPTEQPSPAPKFTVQGQKVLPLAFTIMLSACTVFLAACTSPHPLRGGRAILASGPTGLRQTLTQGDNPSAPTRQNQETIRVRTYTLPPGSTIDLLAHPSTPSLQHSNTPFTSLVLSAPMPVTDREETRASTQLGAAQKDTAREIGAKLSSLKGIVWVGLGLFLFGLATIFWAPLRMIIGSLTTSLAITLGGLALMVLPTLIVGNELLILGGVAALVAAWFLAHRHGELRGQLRSQAHPPLHLSTTPSTPSSRDLRAAGVKHPTT